MGSHEYSTGAGEEAASPDTGVAMAALRRILRALRVSAGEVERALGVSSAQLFVLRQLRRAPGQSIAELAAGTATDQSSVSVVVSRLCAQGLAVRKVSPEDARRAEVSLTPAGRGLLRRAPASAPARLVAALESLPPARRRTLAAGL